MGNSDFLAAYDSTKPEWIEGMRRVKAIFLTPGLYAKSQVPFAKCGSIWLFENTKYKEFYIFLKLEDINQNYMHVKVKDRYHFQSKKYVKPYYSSQVSHIPISSSMLSQEFDVFPEITNNSNARPHMEEPIYPHNSLQWLFMNLLSQCKGSDCQWKTHVKMQD